jgi:hypothetical protein
MKRALERCAVVFILTGVAASDARAQSAVWGYGFVAPGILDDASVVATSYGPDHVTATSFQIYRNVEGIIAWGGGIELQSASGVGVAAEVGAVHRIEEPYYPGGLMALNAVYHLQADRPFTPFVTGGYSFGMDAQHGFDLGAGISYWSGSRTALRLEVRATQLKTDIPGWPEPSEWVVAFRGGLNFARRRF